jgi:predicted ATPase
MFESVRIRNFKTIRDQSVALESLIVIVGPNASGKTSLLQAIEYAVRVSAAQTSGAEVAKSEMSTVWEAIANEFYAKGDITKRGSDVGMSVELGIVNGPRLSVTADPALSLNPEDTSFFRVNSWVLTAGFSEDIEFFPEFADPVSLLHLQLSAKSLRVPHYSAYFPPTLESDGTGLASLLAATALNDPDAFKNLLEDLRALIPGFNRIRFTKSKITTVNTELVRFGDEMLPHRSNVDYLGDAMVFDFDYAKGIPASSVSDGTILVLGLLAVLHGPSQPKVLLLDDIEQGLHPKAQRKLLELLNKLIERSPGLQIIATAHSPYLLDGLKPEQVRLVTLDEHGHSVFGALQDHPQYNQWKDEMTPGEMWSMFGENWLRDVGTPS